MVLLRTTVFALIAALLAGCAGAGTGAVTPPTSASVVASTTRAIASKGNDDDGGRSELNLPGLTPCGNGIFANDCSAWSFGMHNFRVIVSAAPTLSFCAAAADYPAQDLGPASAALHDLSPASFAVSYTGSGATPIQTYVTRPSLISLAGTFSGTSTSATISVSPAAATSVGRGWLVFSTSSSPADVVLVPYDVNEIQVASGDAPLSLGSGSAPLGAFDCLGGPIEAKILGAGASFDPNRHQSKFASASAELNATVYGRPNPATRIVLSDDRGASATISVTQ
jgi:hypothetical protein